MTRTWTVLQRTVLQRTVLQRRVLQRQIALGRLRRRSPRYGERGLSLIELMIATAILTFIAVGILPMLVRSVTNNSRGWDSTLTANMIKSELEQSIYAPFESTPMQLPGSMTENVVKTVWDDGEMTEIGDSVEGWLPDGTPTVGQPLWSRQRRVRVYSSDSLPPWPGTANNEYWTGTPLAGDTPGPQVHLKEIQIDLQSTRSAGLLGARQWVVVQMLKSY
jgi:prepilin-type N-terminal cleavage/methylation domain-containing protein